MQRSQTVSASPLSETPLESGLAGIPRNEGSNPSLSAKKDKRETSAKPGSLCLGG